MSAATKEDVSNHMNHEQVHETYYAHANSSKVNQQIELVLDHKTI
mgnify:CR=1 FL=1|jgi:hypothetical protein